MKFNRRPGHEGVSQSLHRGEDGSEAGIKLYGRQECLVIEVQRRTRPILKKDATDTPGRDFL